MDVIPDSDAEVGMRRASDPIFKGAQVTQQYNSSHDVAAIKTYRYLRLGMLVGVAALGYSVVKEYRQGGSAVSSGRSAAITTPRFIPFSSG